MSTASMRRSGTKSLVRSCRLMRFGEGRWGRCWGLGLGLCQFHWIGRLTISLYFYFYSAAERRENAFEETMAFSCAKWEAYEGGGVGGETGGEGRREWISTCLATL